MIILNRVDVGSAINRSKNATTEYLPKSDSEVIHGNQPSSKENMKDIKPSETPGERLVKSIKN